MDELPRLKFIIGNEQGESKDALMARVERMLSDYPIEYFEPLLQALIDYTSKLEDDTHSNAMYYNLDQALWWYQSYDD